MKFTVNTKPLVEGLNLGILNSNISKYYQKSTIAQIKTKGDELHINLEATSILSEVVVKGSPDAGDGESEAIAFVDSLTLKQLVGTFETATVVFEFSENGLILHSGRSAYTLPYMIDEDAEIEFESPSKNAASEWATIDKSGWKFVKDYQMFAIAMAFIHPVYTRVYVNGNGDVIVGDYDNSMFTHSKKSTLGKACLLADTIVNLFNALPDGATIAENDSDGYIIHVHTDSFDFSAEFTPDYESNPDVGTYNSDIIINMMNSDIPGIKVNVGAINKILNQAALLSSASEDKITFSVSGDTLTLKDKNIDCAIASSTKSGLDYSIDFKTALFKPIISNSPDDEVEIRPLVDEDGEITGILLINKELKSVIAGVD